MKTIGFTFISISIFLIGCSSTQQTAKQIDDDTYYSLSDAKKNANKVYHEDINLQDVSPANPNSSAETQTPNRNFNNYESTIPETPNNNPNYSNSPGTENYVGDDGKTYITNNYYGNNYDDDDYYYRTRIQRFYSPYAGFGYYSPAYCGFYNDPFYYPSMNFGYGWNSYSGWNFGFGWGYGNYYDPFFNPFYSPYSYYNPWGSAWNNGYYNGYNDGWNDHYWASNSPRNKTFYNTPRPNGRGTVGSNGRPTSTGTNVGVGNANTVRPTPGTRNEGQSFSSPSNSTNTVAPTRPTPATSNPNVAPNVKAPIRETPIRVNPTENVKPNTSPSPSENVKPVSPVIKQPIRPTPNGYVAPTLPDPRATTSPNINNNTDRTPNVSPVAIPKSEFNSQPTRRNENPSISKPSNIENNRPRNESRPSYNQPRSSVPSSAPSQNRSSSDGNSNRPSRNRPR